MHSSLVTALADSTRSGWSLCRLPATSGDPSQLAELRAHLEERGFLVLRPGAFSPAANVRDESIGRLHVALVCVDDNDRAAALALLDEPTRVSPRAHVLIDIGGTSWRSPPVRAREREKAREAAVDRRIEALELDAAWAMLSAHVVRARVTGLPVGAGIERRVLTVSFWQGRPVPPFEVSRRCRDPAVIGWRAISAWVRRDARRFASARRALDALSRPRPFAESSFWRRLVRRCRPGERLGRLAADVALLRAAPRAEFALALAVMVDARLARGRRDQAIAILIAARERRDVSPLTTLVASYLTRHVAYPYGAPLDAPEIAAEALIHRAGARGILLFGHGRLQMHWFVALPRLLETLRDAEDDEAALRGGCRWLTRDGGATKAAIVDERRQRLIAADGWTSTDLRTGRLTPAAHSHGSAAVVREVPVRYAGQHIGFVVATGNPDEGETLQSAAEAMASLMAPALRTRLDALTTSARARETMVPEILGRSPAIQALRLDIARAAAVPFPVLIEGESGTGKELVARAIHRLSARRDRRFCALNCAALSDELLEAELFGHSRGAFTGAVNTRTGLFEDAHAGSLFLDEVSELSSRAQAKLLRVVQEREVRRVGENVTRPIDVRLIAATNLPLATAVDLGRFRADLQYRLAVVRLALPPLRDRLEDVPVLAQAFWRDVVRAAGKRAQLGYDAVARLCRHDWPGNIRELQNAIAALVVMAPDRGRVTARHVDRLVGISRDQVVVSLGAAKTMVERQAVVTALARHAGRRAAAARELGMTRQGLTKALKRLGLAEKNRDEHAEAGVA